MVVVAAAALTILIRLGATPWGEREPPCACRLCSVKRKRLLGTIHADGLISVLVDFVGESRKVFPPRLTFSSQISERVGIQQTCFVNMILQQS